MTIFVHIVGNSPVLLWGLSSHERLKRMLQEVGNATVIDDLETIPTDSSLLLIRGDYVFDSRVLNSLIHTPNVMLEICCENRASIVAAHVPSHLKDGARDVLNGTMRPDILPRIHTRTPETLTSAYHAQLKKSDPPFVLPITLEHQAALEKKLFSGAYKGITDLVTKWIWPYPAQWATLICVQHGIRPNHVTITSLVLVIITGWLFLNGHYGWGLMTGWLMTFLDTVDGKLARVTVTSSRIGHLFDHGIDLIHPPLWYLAWGLGLSAFIPEASWLSLKTVLGLIVGGYVVGRLIEGSFQLWLGAFGIFCWRQIDSYHRLITARRNPNLILLTSASLIGRPDIGLVAVALLTIISTLVLLVRFALATYTRLTTGTLHAWFATLDDISTDQSLAIRLFTTQPSTQVTSASATGQNE
ncbi:MAG: CDP-alcohol phosphatidyltransferase [Nitrospiraceae bacterium]|nr:CDP-alcohol phosphatidyltransferase [Nitrospiraceae bacterium]